MSSNAELAPPDAKLARGPQSRDGGVRVSRRARERAPTKALTALENKGKPRVTAEKRDQAVHMSKTRLKQIKRKKQAEQAEEQKLSKDPQPQPRSLKMLKIKKKRPRVSLARMKAGRKALLGYKKTSLATS